MSFFVVKVLSLLLLIVLVVSSVFTVGVQRYLRPVVELMVYTY